MSKCSVCQQRGVLHTDGRKVDANSIVVKCLSVVSNTNATRGHLGRRQGGVNKLRESIMRNGGPIKERHVGDN